MLWAAVILGCVWYFVTDRGFRPIDIDEANSQSSQFVVEVNSASEHEFACLPGIGEKMAQSIIAFREEHGPFESIDSMTEVPRLSPRLLDKVRSFLYLEPPTQPADEMDNANDG
jgi:competence ComEA-like helix-hairpin-helix protein